MDYKEKFETLSRLIEQAYSEAFENVKKILEELHRKFPNEVWKKRYSDGNIEFDVKVLDKIYRKYNISDDDKKNVKMLFELNNALTVLDTLEIVEKKYNEFVINKACEKVLVAGNNKEKNNE